MREELQKQEEKKRQEEERKKREEAKRKKELEEQQRIIDAMEIKYQKLMTLLLLQQVQYIIIKMVLEK